MTTPNHSNTTTPKTPKTSNQTSTARNQRRNPFRPDQIDAKKTEFLEALQGIARGNLILAAEFAGIGESQPYRWRREDSVFAKLMDEARSLGDQLFLADLEKTLMEISKNPEGKYSQAAINVLFFLTKRRDPEYRDNPPSNGQTVNFLLLLPPTLQTIIREVAEAPTHQIGTVVDDFHSRLPAPPQPATCTVISSSIGPPMAQAPQSQQ